VEFPLLTLRSARPLALIGWLLAQACGPAATSLPEAKPPDPPADPPVAVVSAADLPPAAAAPKRPLVAPCPGAPTRFEHRYASGPVGPGHRAATVTTGELQGQTVFLTYTWSGDTRPIDGRPGHSELTWEATLTGEEAAAWHAALAEPLLDHDLLVALPPLAQVPMAAAIGIPLYVCASGATPLAAMAVHKGVSVGAALAFLLSGPATNLTTFTMLTALHGRAFAVRFGVVLLGLAVLTGYAVDAAGLTMPALPHDGAHPEAVSVVSWMALSALGAVGLASLFRQGPRGAIDQIVHPIHAH